MAAGSADQPAPEPAQEGRYGILAVARMRKDDGRSLILYTHDDGVDRERDAARSPRDAASPPAGPDAGGPA